MFDIADLTYLTHKRSEIIFAYKKTGMVAGAAGFIGSRIVLRLLSEGHQVIGVDFFTGYYDRQIKEAKISDLLKYSSFKLIEDDIVGANLTAAKNDVAVGKDYNLGGGTRISLNGVLTMLRQISRKEILVKYESRQAGYPPHTFAVTTSANIDLGFNPDNIA